MVDKLVVGMVLAVGAVLVSLAFLPVAFVVFLLVGIAYIVLTTIWG